jgi:hypothetical protein
MPEPPYQMAGQSNKLAAKRFVNISGALLKNDRFAYVLHGREILTLTREERNEGVWERGAEGKIWTSEEENNMRIKETAQ